MSHGRVELLAHPLSQKYLQMKWNSYGKYFHLANLLFYSVFLFFVTLFSSQLMNNSDIRNMLNQQNVSRLQLYIHSIKPKLTLLNRRQMKRIIKIPICHPQADHRNWPPDTTIRGTKEASLTIPQRSRNRWRLPP